MSVLVSAVEEVPPLGGPVVADVPSGRESGAIDQSQSYPGEGPTEESTEPRAMVMHVALICVT